MMMASAAAVPPKTPTKTLMDLNINSPSKRKSPFKPLPRTPSKQAKIAETVMENADETEEPLLRDNPGRFVIFPIKYHDIWKVREYCRVADGKKLGFRFLHAHIVCGGI